MFLATITLSLSSSLIVGAEGPLARTHVDDVHRCHLRHSFPLLGGFSCAFSHPLTQLADISSSATPQRAIFSRTSRTTRLLRRSRVSVSDWASCATSPSPTSPCARTCTSSSAPRRSSTTCGCDWRRCEKGV